MTQNPFIHRGALKSSRHFWGRSSELNKIYSCLLDSEEEPQSVALLGQRRIGKSSLLYRIFKKELADEMYSEQLANTITVMISMQSLVTSLNASFFERVLDDIKMVSTEYETLVNEIRLQMDNDQERSFGQLLRKLTQKGVLVIILIDEFEAASNNSSFDLNFFEKLRAFMQERRLAFVLSFQTEISNLWDGALINSPNSSPFFNLFQHFTLREFTENEAVVYLQQYCNPDSRCSFSPEEIAIIRKFGGGHPYFINIAAYHLFENKISDSQSPLCTVSDEIENDPAVHLAYKYYWKTLTAEHRKLLKNLVSGKLSYPFPKEIENELYWLYKLSLLEKNDKGTYYPFSESFLAFLDKQTNQKGGGNLINDSTGIIDILSGDESTNLEFKSSLRWDVQKNKENQDLETACLKTIAAFLNTDGGTLVIGVDDLQNVLGLKNDYLTLKKQNKDGFELHLYNIFKSRIGAEFCELISVDFLKDQDKEFCLVIVRPSADPVYVDKEKLYFRTGNSTDFAKTSQDAHKYYMTHWQNNGNKKLP